MERETYLREQICAVGRRLWQGGLAPAATGNICVRLSQEEFLATPHHVSKGFMSPDMILKFRYEPDRPEEERITVLESMGGYRQTVEIRVHLVALHEFPDDTASIHAHCPYCQMFSLFDEEMDAIPLADRVPEAIVSPRIVPWTQGGTWQLAYNNIEALRSSFSRSVIMGRHGLLSLGKDLDDAVMKVEEIEHAAKVAWLYHTYKNTGQL